jgi:hypothetical protein
MIMPEHEEIDFMLQQIAFGKLVQGFILAPEDIFLVM